MIVVAVKPQSVHREVTVEYRERFMQMLPQICKQAEVACRMLGVEARQEFVQSVIADAFVAFARLAELGRVNIAYPTPLAQFAIRHVRSGRIVGTPRNVQDVGSKYGQVAQGIRVQRLDRRYADGCWREILVEDHRTGPAETAAARLDIAAWFASLPLRNRAVASALASGDGTGEVAAANGLSESRVSQLRNELQTSWLSFQNELPEVLARRTRPVSARTNTPDCCAGQSTI